MKTEYDMKKMQTILLITLGLGVQGSSSDPLLQRHKRHWIIDSFSIQEEEKGNFPYALGIVPVENKYQVLTLSGQGVDKDPKGIFSINSRTREIIVHGSVDYEQYSKLLMTFQAFDDRLQKELNTQLVIEIQILDINDHTPTFKRKVYTISLKESTSQGTSIITLQAVDKDSSQTENGRFDMRIVRVTPVPTDFEFYIKQNNDTGTITFKGCLDYMKGEKYTVLVEAKDRGKEIQLSSTTTVIVNIEDENNNFPVFTRQTSTGWVKEQEENVLVLRVQVTDKDTKGTPAWRAKYHIHGDTAKHFRISTDPVTNEGVLYVEKKLDYEENHQWNLSVSVENEAPYHSCKIRGRSKTGLWDVVTSRNKTGTGGLLSLSTCRITVNVEDVNEPPIFTHDVKDVVVHENVALGYYLETFTAIDLDGSYSNNFVYMKGKDPGDWVNVDSKTGKITTAKTLDRESSFVRDNVYAVTVYAVDSGKPPMTGTGTLNIHLKDENDNAPSLNASIIVMCLSDAPSLANITAFDLDAEPYGGPFHFQLHGDIKDKWRLEPENGYSVNLVKENTVYAGQYDLELEVIDLQGVSAIHSLSITVCNCLNTMVTKDIFSCRAHHVKGASLGGGAIGIIFITILLMIGILLLALLLSCERESKLIPDEDFNNHLISFNTECPGTDCDVNKYKVAAKSFKEETNRKMKGIQTTIDTSYKKNVTMNSQGRFRESSMACSHSAWGKNDLSILRTTLFNTIQQRLDALQTPAEELGDYVPHKYADEGDSDTNTQLDAISTPEIPFDADTLLYLGPRFNTLASICRPDAAIS